MSEVKAPERLRLKFCTGCGKNDRFLPFADSHWSSLEGSKCPGEVVHVEYVPATDSPDREPDAPRAILDAAYQVVRSAASTENLNALGQAVKNSMTDEEWMAFLRGKDPPDRSDGLREALERLVAADEECVMAYAPHEHHEQRKAARTRRAEALAAAHLALKAESK